MEINERARERMLKVVDGKVWMKVEVKDEGC